MEWRFMTADARIKLKHLYPVTTVREAHAATTPPPARATAQVA
jgi:hypothetical protein